MNHKQDTKISTCSITTMTFSKFMQYKSAVLSSHNVCGIQTLLATLHLNKIPAKPCLTNQQHLVCFRLKAGVTKHRFGTGVFRCTGLWCSHTHSALQVSLGWLCQALWFSPSIFTLHHLLLLQGQLHFWWIILGQVMDYYRSGHLPVDTCIYS